jgi:L-rhamnose mutarotase
MKKMKSVVHVEYQKAYISDERVKALRDAGITNFSQFVRNCVEGYLEAVEKSEKEAGINPAKSVTPATSHQKEMIANV